MKPLTTRTAPPTATPAAGESARPDEVAGTSQGTDKKLILEVAELSVDYAGAASATAVDKVSFQLSAGEFMAVVGESGCGKSTLLFAVAHLLSPPAEVTGGTVVFNGQSMVALTDKQLRAMRWRGLSVVMQSAMNALNPVISIESQFADAMKAHGEKNPKVIRPFRRGPVSGRHRRRTPGELPAPAFWRHAPTGHDRHGTAFFA